MACPSLAVIAAEFTRRGYDPEAVVWQHVAYAARAGHQPAWACLRMPLPDLIRLNAALSEHIGRENEAQRQALDDPDW